MSAPTPLRVRLPFRSEDEFAAQYGAHVGRDGFFLATRAPKPVGMQLLFDLVLADGSSLLRGEGVVVRSSATGDRPGMTVRFVRLESAGKALVDRIVSGRPARGAAPAAPRMPARAWSTVIVISLVLLGDLFSIYLAALRGVDPGPVTVIEELKAGLTER